MFFSDMEKTYIIIYHLSKYKFWKNEERKTPGDIIIYICAPKNYGQMMCRSWDMVRDRCNCYLSFWAIFCSCTPITTWKIKILKKWNKHTWRYHHFTQVYTKNHDHMLYCSLDRHITEVIIFHFGSFFVLLLPPHPEK